MKKQNISIEELLKWERSKQQGDSPLILDDSEVEEWLDLKTMPDRARDMIRLDSGDEMSLKEMIQDQKRNVPGEMRRVCSTI